MSIDLCNEIPAFDDRCLPPYDVHPSFRGNTSIVITWSNTGADSYTLYISADGSSWDDTIVVPAPVNPSIEPSQTVSGLTPGTTYFFKVTARCFSCACVSDSAIISVATLAA